MMLSHPNNIFFRRKIPQLCASIQEVSAHRASSQPKIFSMFVSVAYTAPSLKCKIINNSKKTITQGGKLSLRSCNRRNFTLEKYPTLQQNMLMAILSEIEETKLKKLETFQGYFHNFLHTSFYLSIGTYCRHRNSCDSCHNIAE